MIGEFEWRSHKLGAKAKAKSPLTDLAAALGLDFCLR